MTHSIDRDRINRLRDLGYKPKFAQVRLDSITGQVQTRNEGATARIKEYKVAIRNGADFPSPVSTEDLFLISGKRTTEANRQLGRTTMKMIVLEDIEWSDARPAEKESLTLLDYEFNLQNGDRPTDAEVLEGLVAARNRGLTQAKMGELFQRDVRWVGTQLQRIIGEEKIEQMGLGDLGLNAVQYRALGRLKHINDDPFRTLARLAADASLTAGQIDTLAYQVNQAGSDNKAIKFLNESRSTQFAARIIEVNRTGRVQKSDQHYALFVAALTAVGKYDTKIDKVFAGQPLDSTEFRQSVLERIETAEETLAAVKAKLVG